ncbi:MAG: heme/hemin ABC transporter substrate-binding protein [Rubrivivax sp.]
MRRLLSASRVADPGVTRRLAVDRRHVLAGLAGLAGMAWSTASRASAPAASRRVVCVGGALTEIVYGLGAEGDLVGVDTTSLHPVEARQLPSVGYARALSVEGVLSLRPTLVLTGPDAGPPAVLRQLEAAGARLARIDLRPAPESLFAAVKSVGGWLGREEAAHRLAAGLSLGLQRARTEVHALQARSREAGRASPRVLFVLSHAMNAVRIAGHSTTAHAMIELAGARNAFASVEGYKPLTPEAAVAAAPDVLLATDQGLTAAGGIDGLLKAPGLALTPAGRARHVVSLDALLLLGFGPRMPQAVEQLARGLHGTRGAA